MTTAKLLLLAILFVGTGGAVFSTWGRRHKGLVLLAGAVSIVAAYYLFSGVYDDLRRSLLNELATTSDRPPTISTKPEVDTQPQRAKARPPVEPTAGGPSESDVRELSRTLKIDGAQPWTDTGLTVRSGDTISIKASGQIIYGDPDYDHVARPGGNANPSGTCNFVVLNQHVPAQALIGNIADRPTLDGKGFFVGIDFRAQVPIRSASQKTGRLFLGFNDGAVRCDRGGYDGWGFEGDNHGSFTARIRITPAQ